MIINGHVTHGQEQLGESCLCTLDVGCFISYLASSYHLRLPAQSRCKMQPCGRLRSKPTRSSREAVYRSMRLRGYGRALAGDGLVGQLREMEADREAMQSGA